MPYAEWQAKHQVEASDAKKAAFEKSRPPATERDQQAWRIIC